MGYPYIRAIKDHLLGVKSQLDCLSNAAVRVELAQYSRTTVCHPDVRPIIETAI